MPKEPKIDYTPGRFIVASVATAGESLPGWTVWYVSDNQDSATVGRVHVVKATNDDGVFGFAQAATIPKATVFGSYITPRAAYFVADRLIELDYVCAGMRSNLDVWRKDAQNALRAIAEAV